MERRIQIGMIGGREVTDELLSLAEKTGELIAKKAAMLICGGLGGIMEAGCKGAKKGGGITVGILPGNYILDANPYVDIAIPTGMGVARNSVIIHSSQGVIAVGGKYGTLSEIAFAFQKGIPVVSLKSWDFDKAIQQASSPEEAVEMIFRKLY
ncbi:MAG: TIGR00725 family protein [bacterium]